MVDSEEENLHSVSDEWDLYLDTMISHYFVPGDHITLLAVLLLLDIHFISPAGIVSLSAVQAANKFQMEINIVTTSPMVSHENSVLVIKPLQGQPRGKLSICLARIFFVCCWWDEWKQIVDNRNRERASSVAVWSRRSNFRSSDRI